MPQTTIVVFRKENGDVPLLDWLSMVESTNFRAFAKCIAKIQELERLGFELKPPHTKLLRDGIYELRIKEGRQNYRVLYFFSGKNIAVLSQGFTKESEVPPAEIALAIANKRLVLQDFDKHTADFEQDE